MSRSLANGKAEPAYYSNGAKNLSRSGRSLRDALLRGAGPWCVRRPYERMGGGCMMVCTGSIVPHSSLPHYFHGLVREALDASRFTVSAETEHYLVQLLTGFGARPAGSSGDDDLFTTPLAFLLKRAVDAPPADKMRKMRDLGDVALYMGGFFSESLRRKLVNRRYYEQMGGGAYATLADMLGGCTNGRTFGRMYGEMAERFGDLLGLLNDIADSQTFDRDDDALRLYEKWLASKSEKLYQRLVSKGMVPSLGSAALD